MGNLTDQNGDWINSSGIADGLWHTRVVSLAGWVGKGISSNLGVSVEGNTPVGINWDSQIADVALVSTDGTVFPMFNQQTIAGSPWNASAGSSFAILSSSDTSVTAHFYLGDHLVTAQMEFSSGGWPVWRGQFAPFGGEIQNGINLPPDMPDGSSNHDKFTGKERDTESGLDYFGARYYASSMGRWMSPDWADKPEAVPYSDLMNPQSLNLCGYVNNNPLSKADADGHEGCCDSLVNFAVGAFNAYGSDLVLGAGRVDQMTSAGSTFSKPSFASTAASGNLQGGQNVPLYSWADTSFAPNGNILAATDTVNGTWQYTYDDMNRLTAGSSSAGPQAGLNLTWSYDRFGNRLNQLATGTGTAVQPQFTSSGGNNRVDTWNYDASGNLLNDATNSYTYDAESRIVTLNGKPTYVYDAEGRRVAKYNSSGTIAASYLLGLGGEQVTELGPAGWVHSNVYGGGNLFATYTAATGRYHYQLTDHLGTKRLQTNAAGNQEETCYSNPFGDGLTCSGVADASEHHFTGKERDAESGLDYFFARYFSSNMGRWMSPDWSAKREPVPYSKLSDPQSINLYGYLTNNPLAHKDADGHGPGWDYAVQTFHDIVSTAKTLRLTFEVGVGLEAKAHLGNLKAEVGGNIHGELTSKKREALSVKAEVAAKVGIGPVKIGGSASAASVVQPDGSLGPVTAKVESPKIELSGDHGPGGTLGPEQVSVGISAYDVVGGGVNVGVDAEPFQKLEGDIFDIIEYASPDWAKTPGSDPQPKSGAVRLN